MKQFTVEHISRLGFKFKFKGKPYRVADLPQDRVSTYRQDHRAGLIVWVHDTTYHNDRGGFFPTEDLLDGLNNLSSDKYEIIDKPYDEYKMTVDENLFDI